MNINDNRQPHCMWHYSARFLWQAKARDNHLLTPELIRETARLYWESQRMPASFATGVERLNKGRFDLTRSVEVVPLGRYTDWGKMERDLRKYFQADIVAEIGCNGKQIVGVSWYSESELTEGLHHVVTLAICDGKYYPMLVTAMRTGR